jgi:enediyne biosynthesis protein E4
VTSVTSGSKIRQRQDVFSGAVFCSQNEMTLHFGLGSATKVDKLEIVWPDGSAEVVEVPAIDKTITITQGKSAKQ